METRRYAEVSALHLEPGVFARLRDLAENQPGRSGVRYDPEDPWHDLIVEPHRYGCWVNISVVEDGQTDGLPASLIAVLSAAHSSGATWVLFDCDLVPLLDLPVFAHPGPAPIAEQRPRRVTFQYLVPVHVEIEDGEVRRVTVLDETPIADPEVIEGDADYLAEALAAADDGQEWPAWRFGH